MNSTPRYSSVFQKADRRSKSAAAAGSVYTSVFEQDVHIQDVYLQAGQNLPFAPFPHGYNMLLPVVGGLLVQTNGEELQLLAGEVLFLPQQEGVRILNPFEETINFLLISLDIPSVTEPFETASLDIREANKMCTGSSFAKILQLGVYESRIQEYLSLDANPGATCAYIINGSFDFEGRLMEYRDALYQWDVSRLEFESLSDNAVLLLINCSR
ncbi:MAG TPA: hypothetical protein VL092_09450 [Chitinophagaceae bacterium]|nr:hypothetical protein [Chitinophagaceae bacterium]